MANPHTTLLLLLLLLVSSSPSFSSARLLNGFSLAATEPALNLALPSAEKEPGHALPCEMVGSGRASPEMRVRASARLAGKYGPLLLNMLPKGSVPPSGPSKGTNDIIN